MSKLSNTSALNRRKITDLFGQSISWLFSSITIAVCFAIIIYLVIKGKNKLSLDFLLTQPAATMDQHKSGGISTPLIGSIILTFIGIIVAFPWSLSTSIYLSEYSERNPVAGFFRVCIDILAGVPTIVIAIFGLAIFSNPQFGFLSSMVEGVAGARKAFGRSFLVCGLTMAVMVLPFIIKTCEEALKAVPASYREGSLAMGASKWHTITKIIIPSASNGIITGVVLGMGRIIGDTAIVWLTLGGTLRMTGHQPWWLPQNWWSALTNTGSTLTSYIFYTSPAGEVDMPQVAFAGSLVLIILIIILNLVVEFIGKSKSIQKEQ